MAKRFFAALLVLSAAVQAQSPIVQTPEALSARLHSAEIDGAAIYKLDHAAALAIDAVQTLKEFRRDKRVGGWLTEDKDGGVLVTFYGSESGSSPMALYQVAISSAGTASNPAILNPAIPLTERQVAQASARSLALHSNFNPCSKTYNTVVLPRMGGENSTWTVYLLAGATKNNVLPAGGNYRVDTDGAGKSILSSRGFTKSCIELDNEKRASALMLTHLLDPAPTEIHVFLSLLAGKPMYLMTTENAYMWVIENGKVRFSQKIQAEG